MLAKLISDWKNLPKKVKVIFILIFFFLIFAQEHERYGKRKTLENLKNGETILWFDISENNLAPYNASSCTEIVEKAHGILTFWYVKDKKFITFQILGDQTPKSKIDYYYKTNPDIKNDPISVFKLLSTDINSDGLIIKVERNDNAVMNFYYNTSDENQELIKYVKFDYFQASQKVLNAYQTSLNAGLFKPIDVGTCRIDSLNEAFEFSGSKVTKKTKKVLPNNEVRSLIKDFFINDEECRGSSDESVQDIFCPRRNEILTKLNNLNWCYGKDTDEGTFKYEWHPCTEGSLKN